MDKWKLIKIISFILLVLGIVMIYLGAWYSPNFMLPPIISGLAFILIAWALNALKDKS